MKGLRSSKAFTLIELIIVIVILGILAAFAAPRFLDFTTDARIAALDALEGAMESSLTLTTTYAKYKRIPDKLNQDLVLPNGSTVRLDYGFPEHTWETAWSNMLDGTFTLKTSGGLCDAETDWCVDSDFNIGDDITISGSSSATVFWPKGTDTADNCYVYYVYNSGSKGNEPTIGKITNQKDSSGNVIPGTGC